MVGGSVALVWWETDHHGGRARGEKAAYLVAASSQRKRKEPEKEKQILDRVPKLIQFLRSYDRLIMS